MEVECKERQNNILFFIYYSHDKFLALLLLNPLEKNPEVAIGCFTKQLFETAPKTNLLVVMLDF